jgi:hypothetical protein
MSMDPLSQLYKGKCHGQVSKQTYDKNMVCKYLKLGIKYKIYENAVLCIMVELDRGCAHLIFPYGVLYGCVAVLSVDAYYQHECLVVVSQFRIATYLL